MPGVKDCYDATGVVNASGQQKCAARACKDSFSCTCDGTSLCSRSTTSVTRKVLKPISGTALCTVSKISEPVTAVIPGGTVPKVSLTGPALRTFNQTHCACAPKSRVVGSTKCYQPKQPGAASTVCSVRACVLKPSDYVCDMLSGASLCERVTTRATAYAPVGPVVKDEVACKSTLVTAERPKCVSSCA
jgi:hypothetical protein